MSLAEWTLIIGWAFVLIWVPLIIKSQSKIHPKALFILFFTELWERFSFYGMRAILILYMTSELFSAMQQGEADAKAYGIYGAYNALLYAAPVIGGMLADRIMGFRKAIVLGGAMMAAGQFALASNASFLDGNMFFFLGLGLLTVGNGFFKPNISSFLGTFYDKNDGRKDGAFTIFYMGINIGAFLAPITCGYLGEVHGWHWGFLVAGIGMIAGLVIFHVFRNELGDKGHPPNLEELKKPVFAGLNKHALIVIASLVSVPVFAILIDFETVTDWILIVAGLACLGYIIYTALTLEDRQDGQRLLVFVALFFFHMIFWALFEQAGGSINILTKRFVNTHGIEASMFQSLNPLYIMLLAPVFAWVWRKLNKAGREPRTPNKFFYGLLQMALGYFVIVLGVKAGIAAGATPESIPLIFLLCMYLFHTTGELALSPVGLSVVTKLSTEKVVGFVMGSWFLSIAFAHKIAGKLGQMIASPGEDTPLVDQLQAFSDVYLIWGVYVVLGAAAVLLLLSPVLKKWMHGIH